MQTASIREVRHDFNRVRAWVNNGEEVAITRHRRTVARLVSARVPKAVEAGMPDIAGRLHKVFGRRVIPDPAIRAMLDESRGGVLKAYADSSFIVALYLQQQSSGIAISFMQRYGQRPPFTSWHRFAV